MSWDQEVDVALAAVRRAALVCRAVQRDVDPQTLQKKDRSPVTVADFASQALVARSLLQAFPDDPLIGEEDAAALREPDNAERRQQVHARVAGVESDATVDDVLGWIDHGRSDPRPGRTWVLDPVDGTKGFLRGQQYAVALALLLDGEVEVAALGCPNLPLGGSSESIGSLMWAVRGQGAYQTPLYGEGRGEAIDVSTQPEVSKLRLCESVESGHSSHDHSAQVARQLGLTESPVRLDSQAKYGVVARGGAELYLRLPTRPGYREKVWDHAAGALVVAEAGGTVTDVDGRALDFHHGRHLDQNRGVVVSHGPHHAQVLEVLRSLNI